MAKENLSWGAKRIRGELLKLKMKASKSAIQKYIQGGTHPSRLTVERMYFSASTTSKIAEMAKFNTDT